MPTSAAAATPEPLRCSDLGTLPERYDAVRTFSTTFCEPLNTEDFVVQTVENVSPTKWHLAHTTWFFETFILEEHAPDYTPIDETYAYLFNSYYIQAGAPLPGSARIHFPPDGERGLRVPGARRPGHARAHGYGER